jgi:hypothetical protein
MQTVIFLMCSMLCAQDLEQPKRDAINFMALNYKANLQSFRFCEVQFDVLHAGSYLAEEPFEDAFVGEGYYAFDGVNAVYHCVYDDKSILEHSKLKNTDQVVATFSSRRMLWDGKSTLMDLISPDLRSNPKKTFHTAEIFEDPDGSRFMSEFSFPIGVGFQDKAQDAVGRMFAMLLDGRLKLEDLSVGPTENGKIARIVLRDKYLKRMYQISLDKGSLPLEIVYFDPDGNQSLDIKYDEMELVEGAGWISKRMTVRSKSRNDTRITRLKSCNVTRKPEIATFRLDFDEPVNIMEPAKQVGYYHRKTFSLVDRPRLNAGATRINVRKTDPPLSTVKEMPGELPPPSLRRYVMLAAMIVALALAGVAYTRYRRS